MKAAVVEIATNIVVNIIVADPNVDPPPEGCILVDCTDTPCDIGWVYDPQTGTFSPPPEPVV